MGKGDRGDGGGGRVGLYVAVCAQPGVGGCEQLVGVDGADGVDLAADGVDGCEQLAHILTHVLRAYTALVHAVEVGVKLEVHVFARKLLAAEWHVAACARAERAIGEIFKHLSAVELQEEPGLVFGKAEAARVGEYHAGIVAALRHIVHYHAVEHAGLGIFVVDVEIHAGNLVVKRFLGYLHLGRLLPHGKHQCPHPRLGYGQHIVLEEKCADGYQAHQHHQRRHDAEEGYAGGFHGGELELLAEIAKYHQRREQHGQRQGGGHHGEGGVEKELAEHVEAESFTHQVVDHAIQKLHQHDKQADKKRHQQQRSKPLQHERVEPLESKHRAKLTISHGTATIHDA